MKTSGVSLLALLLLGLAGCQTATSHRPLPTVAHVDLRRYCGQWHEVARLPNGFQKADESALAEYLPAANGGVRVINTARRPDGTTRTIRGTAEAVPGSGNARLRVKLGGVAALAPVSEEGNYWIIAVDPEHYRYAMVGTPDRKYLWLLSRSPELDRATAARLIGRAKELGFATSSLLWDPK